MRHSRVDAMAAEDKTLKTLSIALLLSFGITFVACPRQALGDDIDLSLLPSGGIISGLAGSTIGWGYTITNNTSDWVETTGLSSDVFNDIDPSSLGFIFDYPDVAPDSSVTELFSTDTTNNGCTATPCGLFELTWLGSAPGGFSNTGTFDLSLEFFDGDPNNGGTDLGFGPADATVGYEADVTPTTTSSAPEPATWLLLPGALALIFFAGKRKAARSAVRSMTVLGGFAAIAASGQTTTTPTVYNVTTTTDNSACTSGGTCSLRGAIVAALAAGPTTPAIVNLPAGTYTLSQSGNYCDFSYHNEIPLCLGSSVNLSIVGAGAASTIIDANHTGQIFLIDNAAANLSISGVTLTNGTNSNLSALGGAITINQGALTVSDSVFTANTAIYGGAISLNGSSLSVFRTTFSFNIGTYGGAAIYGDTGTIAIVDSTFSNNNSLSCCGTVMNNMGSAGSMTITGSTFTSNTGWSTIYNNNYAVTTITNSTIANNTSPYTGAGIGNGSFVSLYLYGDTIYGNSSGSGGGGLNGGATAMANTIIAGNSTGDQNNPGPDCNNGTITSLGHNLIQNTSYCPVTGTTASNLTGVNPLLGTLTSNGGPTQTLAPQPGSPAVGAGSTAAPGSGSGACPSADQRGITRQANHLCDIGSVQTGGTLAVSAITPAGAANTGVAIVTISGNDFSPSATVKLSRAGSPDIPASQVTVDGGEAELAASFNLTGAALGAWDVVVTNPDATTATLPSGFLVEPAQTQTPIVTTDIVGPTVLRPGVAFPVTVLIHNRSNTNAYGVTFGLQLANGYTVAPAVATLVPPAQAGQQATDWTQVPAEVDASLPLNFYPYFLPFVPAGYTGSLTFNVTSPILAHGTPFSITESSTDPIFDPSLDAGVASNLVAAAQAWVLSSGLTIPTSDSAAMLTYLTNQYSLAQQAAISSVADTSTLTLPTYSLVQLQFDLASYGANLAGSLLSGSNSSAAPELRERARTPVPASGGNGHPCGAGTSCSTTLAKAPVCSTLFSFLFGGSDGCQGYCASGDCGGNTGVGKLEGSLDPNSISGPTGVTASQYLAATSPLNYIVGFSNEATADLPAQTVVVTDQLDTSKFDPGTFSLGAITVTGISATPPPGTQQYSTLIDLRPTTNLLARVDAGINVATGLITWTFTSIDPATLEQTTNVTAGLLPPDTAPPNGEAQVLFTVSPLSGLATGTALNDQATVVFDANPSMSTSVWSNLVDVTAPQSRVASLNASAGMVTIPVNWSGSDAGSGISTYSVYVSTNGGTYSPWLSKTALTSSNFTGVPGQSYSFYSQAQDAVGNLEPTHATADATVTLTAGTPRIAATVADTGTANGSFYVDLNVTDSGTAPVTSVLLSTITPKTLTGTGTLTYNAALSGPLPLSVGSLAVGGVTMVRIYFTRPSTVTRFSLTENGTLTSGSGSASFSASQVVTP